jgi:hypothetical protein
MALLEHGYKYFCYKSKDSPDHLDNYQVLNEELYHIN